MNEIKKLEDAYEFYKKDEEFNLELNTLLKEYAGRPSLLYYAEKMTKDQGGAKIYFKREDLNHTGSHQINNVLVFPGIFRGALDAKATGITEEMKMAAAKAIASIVTDEELNEEYIIPGAFDDRVAKVVAKAVADEAHKLGITK